MRTQTCNFHGIKECIQKILVLNPLQNKSFQKLRWNLKRNTKMDCDPFLFSVRRNPAQVSFLYGLSFGKLPQWIWWICHTLLSLVSVIFLVLILFDIFSCSMPVRRTDGRGCMFSEIEFYFYFQTNYFVSDQLEVESKKGEEGLRK